MFTSRSTPAEAQATTAAPGFGRVVAFEMEVQGHHPGYVKSFARTWVENEIPGAIDFVVTPRFYELHSDEVNYVENLSDQGVTIRKLTDAEADRMERVSYLRYFHAWRYFCEYAERLSADHGLLMYYDFFQLPSVVGRKCPVPYSGIYFRPTFHYHLLQSYQPTFRERLKAWRKKALLSRVVRDPQLRRLYCLDEFAVDYMKQAFRTTTEFQHLADSFTIYATSHERQQQLRTEFGVEAGRRLFTLLGVLDRRKGVAELLACLSRMSSEAAKKTCVLLVGVVHPNQREVVEELTRKVASETDIQVVLHNQFIREEDIQHIYDMSDIILATYQGHMGSSSALIRAALAGKPVLSADYGLMGEIVERRQLGVLVDTRDPAAMAAQMQRLAMAPDLSVFYDPEQATKYAAENSPEQLASDLATLVHSN